MDRSPIDCATRGHPIQKGVTHRLTPVLSCISQVCIEQNIQVVLRQPREQIVVSDCYPASDSGELRGDTRGVGWLSEQV